MKPSKLKPGQKLQINFGSHIRDAVFVRRFPAEQARRAINILVVSDFVGMTGRDDKGEVQMSDYELSRKGVNA